MSLRMMVWALHDAPVENPVELLVLVVLGDEADDDGWCWPSQRRIATKSRLSTSGARRPIERLEAAGLIDVYRPPATGRGHFTTYQIRTAGDGQGGPSPAADPFDGNVPPAHLSWLSTDPEKRAQRCAPARAFPPINAHKGARQSAHTRRPNPVTQARGAEAGKGRSRAPFGEPLRTTDGHLFIPGVGWLDPPS